MELSESIIKLQEIIEKMIAEMSDEEITRIKVKYKLEKENID